MLCLGTAHPAKRDVRPYKMPVIDEMRQELSAQHFRCIIQHIPHHPKKLGRCSPIHLAGVGGGQPNSKGACQTSKRHRAKFKDLCISGAGGGLMCWRGLIRCAALQTRGMATGTIQKLLRDALQRCRMQG